MQVAVAARAGRPAWLNRRTILGAVLVVISIASGWTVLERGKATIPVWVAARDLPVGAVLDGATLRVEHVNLSPRLARSYVRSATSLEGMTVTRPMAEGELVPAAWVSEAVESRSRAVTIPIEPEHAVGGALRPGERVDVYATFDAGEAHARTVVLLRAAEVIDLVTAGGLVMGERAVIGLTVAVAPEDAQRVAFASHTGRLDVVRVDGSSDASRSGPITSSDL